LVYRNQTSTDLNKPKNTYGCFLVCQGLRPKIIITKILKVFEDWEYIEGLKQKFALIKGFSRSPSPVQGLI